MLPILCKNKGLQRTCCEPDFSSYHTRLGGSLLRARFPSFNTIHHSHNKSHKTCCLPFGNLILHQHAQNVPRQPNSVRGGAPCTMVWPANSTNHWPPIHITRACPKTALADLLLMTTRTKSYAHNALTISRPYSPRIIDRNVISERFVHTGSVLRVVEHERVEPLSVQQPAGRPQATTHCGDRFVWHAGQGRTPVL